MMLVSLMIVATFMLETAARAQVSGDWIPTSGFNTPRYGLTATLLANGKVLVAGGYNTGYLNSAELYDPATGTWSFTGSLNTPRYLHTATLLANGKVLVVGGYNGGFLNSAELYDPATGTWIVTGSLNTPRYVPTATLLANGKVLVVGGDNSGSSAELYDPATGTWSITGSLKTPRGLHTATLLPNGKVLVAAGFTGIYIYTGDCPCIDPVTNNAEIYDPATGTWSVTGNLKTPRGLHTATLLPNGKVLAAGGTDGTLIDIGEFVPFSSAELYDPATGNWSLTASLNTARNSHTATLLSNGKVLAAAGYYTDTAELYDPSTGVWSFTASLSTPGSGHTATLLQNGQVLVAGDDSAELYDPTAEGSLPTLPLMISAPVLPDAEVGVAYSAPLVSGGHPPYTVNNVKGVFPQGLSDTLASGALSGTPASSRSKSFTIQITDDLGSSVTGTFTVKIFRALENTTRALKTGINGRPYKATLKAAGGKKPYNWFLVSGNLPAGLTLNSLTGAIAGIPVESGTFDLTFHVTDPVGGIAETALTLTIK
jgi:N-acetylneuraminic acid mutarotase